jgi:short-subunit dehydrogenase
MELEGKVALITGGSTGYGKGTAEVLNAKGLKVWIISRGEELLKETAGELGVNYIVGDITKPEDWDRIIKNIEDRDGSIDILINNAGAGVAIKPLVEQTDKEIEESIKINLIGHIYGMRRIGKNMIKQKSGIIINITSLCGEYAWPDWSVYSAAKAGIEQLGRCLHNEFRTNNVHIVTLAPAWGTTNFLAAADLPERSEDVKKNTMKPEEMGDLIVKICTTPDHLIIPYLPILPMVQEINPM